MLLSLSSPFTFISVPLEQSCGCTQTAELALYKSEVVVILSWLIYVAPKKGAVGPLLCYLQGLPTSF